MAVTGNSTQRPSTVPLTGMTRVITPTKKAFCDVTPFMYNFIHCAYKFTVSYRTKHISTTSYKGRKCNAVIFQQERQFDASVTVHHIYNVRRMYQLDANNVTMILFP